MNDDDGDIIHAVICIFERMHGSTIKPTYKI